MRSDLACIMTSRRTTKGQGGLGRRDGRRPAGESPQRWAWARDAGLQRLCPPTGAGECGRRTSRVTPRVWTRASVDAERLASPSVFSSSRSAAQSDVPALRMSTRRRLAAGLGSEQSSPPCMLDPVV
eukprot:354830-Chlamydomonas_euryale.AAC.1